MKRFQRHRPTSAHKINKDYCTAIKSESSLMSVAKSSANEGGVGSVCVGRVNREPGFEGPG